MGRYWECHAYILHRFCTVHMSKINCLTWNIRGVNDNRKARLIHAYLIRYNIDLCLLQETHIQCRTSQKLKHNRWRDMFLSVYSNYSRGVAVLVRRGLDWREKEVYTDPEGRFVIILGYLSGTLLTLVALYGPNTDSPSFFQDVWARVKASVCTLTLWGGDFNVILNNELDRQGTARTHNPAASKVLNWILESEDMTDIWRDRNPLLKEGTCFSEHRHAWSRLDYWVMTRDVASWVVEVRHLARTLSDHAPCLLTLQLPNTIRPAFSWRLPRYALIDAVFKEDIRSEIANYFTTNIGSVTSEATVWEAFKVVIRGHCISKQAGVLKAIRTTLATMETQIRALEAQICSGDTAGAQAELKL